MKVLRLSVSYGDDEFTTIIHPPATQEEYHQAILTAIGIINEVAAGWAHDARKEYWEGIVENRTTVEEF